MRFSTGRKEFEKEYDFLKCFLKNHLNGCKTDMSYQSQSEGCKARVCSIDLMIRLFCIDSFQSSNLKYIRGFKINIVIIFGISSKKTPWQRMTACKKE